MEIKKEFRIEITFDVAQEVTMSQLTEYCNKIHFIADCPDGNELTITPISICAENW